MTQGSDAENPSRDEGKDSKDAAGEKQRVARTRLDIKMDDLIDPLTDPTAPTAQKNRSAADKSQGENRLSKTLLESSGPSLQQIKALSESGKFSIAAKSSDTDNSTAAKPEESTEETTPLKQLAKTIPETDSAKLSLVAPEQSVRADDSEDAVAIKELAKTLPDPHMQERKAVAARIARIRSFQKTVQVKRPKFSKTMAESNLEILDVLRESGQWKALPSSQAPAAASSTLSAPASSTPSASASSTPSASVSLTPSASVSAPAPKKIGVVREQFVVARTKLDHNILFQAVSDSKVKEEARVAQLLVEKSKEAPKPPPVPVKADRTASACPFKWEETDSKEKYRYCTKCQTPVYNFEGMERPEAEALIFNRENLHKFTLFGREDGKFMTTDCPVQKTRTKNLILSIVAAVALILGGAALLIFMPRPSPETASTTDSSSSARNSSTSSDSGTSSTGDIVSESREGTADASGVVTFKSTDTKRSHAKMSAPGASSAGSGTGYQTFKLPSASQKGSKAPDPDEDGHFWNFN